MKRLLVIAVMCLAYPALAEEVFVPSTPVSRPAQIARFRPLRLEVNVMPEVPSVVWVLETADANGTPTRDAGGGTTRTITWEGAAAVPVIAMINRGDHRSTSLRAKLFQRAVADGKLGPGSIEEAP